MASGARCIIRRLFQRTAHPRQFTPDARIRIFLKLAVYQVDDIFSRHAAVPVRSLIGGAANLGAVCAHVVKFLRGSALNTRPDVECVPLRADGVIYRARYLLCGAPLVEVPEDVAGLAMRYL